MNGHIRGTGAFASPSADRRAELMDQAFRELHQALTKYRLAEGRRRESMSMERGQRGMDVSSALDELAQAESRCKHICKELLEQAERSAPVRGGGVTAPYGVDVVREHPKERPLNRRDPFDCMVPGDVVRLGGHLRVVRFVRRDRAGLIRQIEVIKIRRSGHVSPTTIILRADMYTTGGYPFRGIVGKHVLCGGVPVECAVQEQIDRRATERNTPWTPPEVTERDIVGIVA